MNYSSAKATLGYGLTLMLVFVASTVMLGSSLQMMAGPISMAYLGTASQENLAARELANAGMDAVIADLQSKYDNGQSITTGYSYASSSAPSSVLMPSNPNAPGTLDATVGTYTGAISAINGNNMLVSVTATVGSGVYQFNKLLSLSRNPTSLDNVTGATAAYGMRKLRSAYAGSAIRVRRGSDNVEQDIGFNASGALDVAALRNFLENSTTYPKPLDAVTTSAAAYSLRKLRNAYTGSAIRVRRSSDSTEQDIGFDLAGNLDVNALVDFVGTGSGYVKTWYDQSGNLLNQNQATTTAQPLIVNAGVLVTVQGRPAILFDGVDDYVGSSFNVSNNFSILAVARTNVTHQLDAKATSGTLGASGEKYLIWGNATRTPDSEALISMGTNGLASYENSSSYTPALSAAPLTIGSNLVSVTLQYNAKQPSLYLNSQLVEVGYTSPKPNVFAGQKIGGTVGGYGFHSGEVSEVIYYASSISTTNRQTLENDAARYYQINATDYGYATPLDIAPGSVAAYGLRKLRSAYGGSALRVRRTSDSATQDIGFDAKGNLDVATLMNFVGASDGKVTIWYDQSGTNNATQVTAAKQPRIVISGVLNTNLNGKPSLSFGGVNTSMITSTYVADFTFTDLTANLVLSNCSGGVLLHKGNGNSTWEAGEKKLWMGGGDTNEFSKGLMPSYVGYDDYYALSSGSIPSGNGVVTYTWDYISGSSGTPTFYINGVSTGLNLGDLHAADTDTGSNVLQIGTGPGGSPYQGDISEIVIYGQIIGTRDLLEDNQMAYYNITGALPGSGFVTKWYDQSGNGYDFSQSTYLLQPQIMWDNITNRPAIYYNGKSNYMTTGTTLSFTGTQATAFAVANMASTSLNKARLFSATVTTPQNDDAGTAGAAIFFCQNNGASQLMGYRVGAPKGVGSISTNKTIQATSIFDGTNQTIRINRIAGTSVASSGNFNIVQLWTGASPYSASTDWWSGTISELILYPSNPTATQIQNIEEDQRSFYGTP